MSIRDLPAHEGPQRPANYSGDTHWAALEKWVESPKCAEADDPNTIDVFGIIGEDFFEEGFTERRMAGALRKIGKNDITVNINSPGGDMFAGLAIYNLLREHPAKVTVKVLGLAASAASLVAMAGDNVLMGTGSIMMIHRAWGLALGNTHDFANAAEVFGVFDQALADIYAAHTGIEADAVLALLDGAGRAADGTWMNAQEAVDQGFADGIFDGPDATAQAESTLPAHIRARRQIEADLAKAGLPRSVREQRIKALLGERDATQPAARDAGDEQAADIQRLIETLKT